MSKIDKISQTESVALSLIRVIAMILIVSCHIAQYFDLRIAYLLNIGVQIFFFMSGFLYGRLDISGSPFRFYKKRFVKVYLPYYILLVIVIIIYAVFQLYHFNVKQIVLYLFNLQWFSVPIDGLNHLWFLTVLLVSYLLTPWVKKLHNKKPFLFIFVFALFCIVEFILVRKFYSFCAWVALYFAGMLFGMYYSKRTLNHSLIIGAIALVVLLLWYKSDLLIQYEFRHYAIWLHWILGSFLFVVLFRLLPLVVKPNKEHLLLKHLDSVSYEVYLIHHPLILGPLSIMSLTSYVWLNILLLLGVVYVLSRLFHYVSSFSKTLI